MTTGLRGRLALFQSTVRVGKGPKGPVASEPKSEVPRSDRYELLAELGKGGMGRVERGIDRFLGRTVALKWSLDNDPKMLQMLLREAEIASRLNHPSIVTIHDVARDEREEPFVVMRLVDGKRLSEYVAAATDLAGRLFLVPRVLAAIDAIAYAHDSGVVHRDLKPDNILLGEHGETVVIDWGLALDRDEPDPFEGAAAGTPGFMSPEQEVGERVDPRTDVYALGVTLFWVLTGKLPGKDATIADELMSLERGVPRDLIAIVRKATARPRDERYPTAAELAGDLRSFIGGQLVAAHHYSVAQRIARWVRAHRAAVAIGVVAMIALAVVATILLRRVVAAKTDAEHERGVALARGDQLLIDAARAALPTDPARSLALLDLREAPGYTPDAWAISVDAYTRGIPRVWEAHHDTRAVVALGDGRVVSSGVDGTLVLRHPDGRRTELTGPRDGGNLYAAPNGFVVIGPTSELFDLEGRRVDTWQAGTMKQSDVAGGWAVWSDDRGAWARELATRTTKALPAAWRMTIDPTGRYCAITTTTGVSVVELATGATSQLAPTAEAFTLRWSESGRKLLGTIQNHVVAWDATDWAKPGVQTKLAFGIVAEFLGERVVAIDAGGCANLLETPIVAPCRRLGRQSFGLGPGQLAISDGQSIALYTSKLGVAIAAELAGVPGTIARADISSDGREIAGGTREGRIALWKLGSTVAWWGINNVQARFAPDGSIVTLADGEVIELRVGQPRRSFGRVGPGLGLVAAPMIVGSTAFVRSDRIANLLYRIDGDNPVLIASNIIDAVPHGHELLVGTLEGEVAVLDPVSRASRLLVRHSQRVASMASDGDRIAAAWEDGHVWWRSGSTTRTAELGCKPHRVWITGGTVEVACGGSLFDLSGETPRILMRDTIIDISFGPDDRVLLAADHAVWRIVDGIPRRVTIPTADAIAISHERIVIAEQATGAVYVVDVASGARARIGTVQKPISVTMSADGRRVLVSGAFAVMLWVDPSPRDPTTWPAWKAAITPATMVDSSAPLEWR